MNIISLGVGVQSTTLYLMSSTGVLPRADYAIFADTGGEKTGTLKYLKWLMNWQKINNGVPIIVVRERNLYKDLLNSTNSTGQRFSPIPAFTKNGDGTKGMIRRQCTFEYKIRQVDLAIRKIYGLKPRQRNIPTIVWKGITIDEAERASIPQNGDAWKTFFYPFLNLKISSETHEFVYDMIPKMYRSHCTEWLKSNSFPVPPKSSCFFCPYMSDASLSDMKQNEPKDWKRAVKIDKAIRNSTRKGIKSPAYLHNSCIPLEDVVFSHDPNQLNIEWGECSGNCHN